MAAPSKGIDVAHIAALARLKLSPEAAAKLGREMESIVGYVEMLSELDVSGIEPTAHAVPRSNVIRDDKVKESFPRELMLANAPAEVNQELVRVPQVLAEEGIPLRGGADGTTELLASGPDGILKKLFQTL